MPTTADYLQDLINQRNLLADNLNAMGVNASQTEKLNTLMPKVLTIDQSKNNAYGIWTPTENTQIFSLSNLKFTVEKMCIYSMESINILPTVDTNMNIICIIIDMSSTTYKATFMLRANNTISNTYSSIGSLNAQNISKYITISQNSIQIDLSSFGALQGRSVWFVGGKSYVWTAQGAI